MPVNVPKISVIIPVYNVAPYIRKCLDSLVNQTLTDIEFICINDGSTDNSLEILNEYAAQDSRFVIISQENQGQGVARNTGLEIAKGEYIAFVDPDDYIAPKTYETVYNKLKETNAQIVQFDYQKVNAYSRQTKKILLTEELKKFKCPADIENNPYYNWQDIKKCMFNLRLAVWDRVYSRDLIVKNNLKFAPIRCAEDHIFSLGAMFSAEKIYYLNKCFYTYRCRENSATTAYSNGNFCIFDNVCLVEELLKKYNLLQELQTEFTDYKKCVFGIHYELISPERKTEYLSECKKLLPEKEYKNLVKRIRTHNKSLTEQIFSIKNRYDNAKKLKVVTLLGREFFIEPKAEKV